MLFSVPIVIGYEATCSPVARVSEPVNVSLPTRAPTAVMNVRAGSLSPKILVLGSAVTVMGLALIVSLAVV